MNAANRLVIVLALVGLTLGFMDKSYGAVYDHFKADPLHFNEEDLVMLADAFHIESHYQDQKQSLLNGIQNCISNATNQTGQIGGLIDSTQGLIKVVKDAADKLSNPGNFITSTIKDKFKQGWGSLFGRLLQNADKGAVAKFVDSLEYKVAEAKTEQKGITEALSNSNKFLGLLQGIGDLLSGNTNGFKAKISQYLPSWLGGSGRRLAGDNHNGIMDLVSQLGGSQENAANAKASWLDNLKSKIGEEAVKQAISSSFGGQSGSPAPQASSGDNGWIAKIALAKKYAGNLLGSGHLEVNPTWAQKLSHLYQSASAHLEVLSEKTDAGYGRLRKSLYQQRADKHRLVKMAGSLKSAAHYLNSVEDDSINFNRLENHLYDLAVEGGATGKAYLRGVETLKCILLKINCPEIRVIPGGYTKNVYFGQSNAAQVKSLQGALGGAAVQAVKNEVVNNGTDTIVRSSLDQPQLDQLRIDPGILSGQLGFGSVSQGNGFNPSQGNEAIIVTNESPISRLPAISDIVSGVQYATVVNQPVASEGDTSMLIGSSNADTKVATQASSFNIVAPAVNGSEAVTYTIGVNDAAAANGAVEGNANSLLFDQSLREINPIGAPIVYNSSSGPSGESEVFNEADFDASVANAGSSNSSINLNGVTLNNLNSASVNGVSAANAGDWVEPEPTSNVVYSAN